MTAWWHWIWKQACGGRSTWATARSQTGGGVIPPVRLLFEISLFFLFFFFFSIDEIVRIWKYISSRCRKPVTKIPPFSQFLEFSLMQLGYRNGIIKTDIFEEEKKKQIFQGYTITVCTYSEATKARSTAITTTSTASTQPPRNGRRSALADSSPVPAEGSALSLWATDYSSSVEQGEDFD